MAKLKGVLAAGFCVGILAGCGGGGDSSAPAATAQTAVPEGFFVGATSSGRTSSGVVLDDGSYYVIYSAQNNPAVIAGAVVGNGTALNGTFSSTNAKDINLEGLGFLSASVSASYVAKQSLNGSVTYPSLSQTVTFTGAYDARYELTPSLAIIAGSYMGRAGAPSGAENASLTISGAGAVAGIGTSGCTFRGTVAPKAKGNVYSASITFGGSSCRRPNAILTGIAYFDAPTARLYAVGLTAARDDGVIFAGSKL